VRLKHKLIYRAVSDCDPFAQPRSPRAASSPTISAVHIAITYVISYWGGGGGTDSEASE